LVRVGLGGVEFAAPEIAGWTGWGRRASASVSGYTVAAVAGTSGELGAVTVSVRCSTSILTLRRRMNISLPLAPSDAT
jgi:hypothetical protein